MEYIKMKIIVKLALPLSVLVGSNLAATNMNSLKEDLAKDVVNSILSDKALLNAYENGSLNLDGQFVVDHFGERIKKATKKVTSTVKKGTKKVVSKLPVVKEIAGDVASLANKALSKITKSDQLMNALKTSAGVINKLLPIGTNALALGIGYVPVVGPVLSKAVDKVAPYLEKAVTPDNMEKALMMAAKVAEVADALLNPVKDMTPAQIDDLAEAAEDEDERPVVMENTSVKSDDKMIPVENDVKGKAVELTLEGARHIIKFVQTLPPGSKIPTQLLDTIDKANKVVSLIK
jgi:hypothetical protein